MRDASATAGAAAAARFSTFLERSLASLERAVPIAYEALAHALAGRVTAVDVGGDRVAIVGSGRRIQVLRTDSGTAVEFATDMATVLALLDGDLAFVDALLANRIRLAGGLQEIAAFYDALMLYLSGAVRDPHQSELLAELYAAHREAADAR